MAPIPELIAQLKQATATTATPLRDPMATGGLAAEVAMKLDQDTSDRASTGSGSRSADSTQEFQPYKGFDDELANRLMRENAKLTRRIDEIESKLIQRIDGALVPRIDELENGVSVVIHDLISLRRQIDAKPKEAMPAEGAEDKFQKLNDAVQGLMVDVSTCKVVLKNMFGVTQLTSALGTPRSKCNLITSAHSTSSTGAAEDRASDFASSCSTPSGTQASFEPTFTRISVPHDVMSKTAPVRCELPGPRTGSMPTSRIASQRASPMQSQQPSRGSSPIRFVSTNEQVNGNAIDRRPSLVHATELHMQQGSSGREGKLHDQKASPVPGPIPEDSEAVCAESQILDRMLAESEKTLGKIKMIAQSRGLSVNRCASPHGAQGQGSASLPVGQLQPQEKKGSVSLPVGRQPQPQDNTIPPWSNYSVASSAPRSRIISAASSTTQKTYM